MRPVWLDTDPGFDDWLAMLMLAAHPGLRWLGISVVAGNAPLDVTLANALRIRHHYGLKVPIHRGSAAPLADALQTAQHVLGPQGMRTTGEPLPEVSDARPDGDDGPPSLIRGILRETKHEKYKRGERKDDDRLSEQRQRARVERRAKAGGVQPGDHGGRAAQDRRTPREQTQAYPTWRGGLDHHDAAKHVECVRNDSDVEPVGQHDHREHGTGRAKRNLWIQQQKQQREVGGGQ